MNNFTYPVLLEDESAYKNNILFRLENVTYSFDEKNMNIECDCLLNSEYLLGLIRDKKAYILLAATTVMNKYIEKIENFEEKVKYSVPLECLIDSDNVNLQAYILVKQEFDLNYCKEMESIYEDFGPKHMNKNMQLGISNNVILYYRTVENSFVSLDKSSELEDKGIRVNFENDKAICIKAGNSFCDAYNAVSNGSRIAKNLMDCMIAFIGIYQTSISIMLNKDVCLDKIKEYEWYEGFEYMFAQRGKNVDEFFQTIEDPQELFVAIQEVVGNEIEKTFIRCRELYKKGGDEDE